MRGTGAGSSSALTERASAQLTLQEASSVTHSLCGGRISGKQSQRGSLIRSQPNSAGSSLYRLPGAHRAPCDEGVRVPQTLIAVT